MKSRARRRGIQVGLVLSDPESVSAMVRPPEDGTNLMILDAVLPLIWKLVFPSTKAIHSPFCDQAGECSI